MRDLIPSSSAILRINAAFRLGTRGPKYFPVSQVIYDDTKNKINYLLKLMIAVLARHMRQVI